MNIPGPRKQPSVSPPGQIPGQPQIITQQHFATRGPTQPINIRSQAPEAFEGPQLQYQRFNSPRFPASPSAAYAALGSSPHQHLAHIAQAQQQQIRAPQTLVVSPDNTHLHPVYLQPPVGGQPPHNQQPNSSQTGGSPRPHTLQLTSQPQVGGVYTAQPQPGVYTVTAQQTPYTGQLPSQPGQQPPTQQPLPGSYPPQQQQRYPQPVQHYHPGQRPPTPQQQVQDVQVNQTLSHPQQPQVLISQAYSQSTVTHDMSKAPLPQRGQTPPQPSLQANMYNPAQTQRQPSPQTFVPRNMGTQRPRHQLPNMTGLAGNANVFQQPPMGIQFVASPSGIPQQVIVQQANPNAQIQIQYPPARVPQPYTITSQQQNPYNSSPGYYQHQGNQMYMGPGAQTQWTGVQQPRAPSQSTSQPTSTYQKRTKKILKITDPTTGEDINLNEVASTGARSSSTPPQSGSSSNRATPVSSSTPPTQRDNGSIAAQFATQVAATLNDKSPMVQQPGGPPGGPPQPLQQVQLQQGQVVQQNQPGHSIPQMMVPPMPQMLSMSGMQQPRMPNQGMMTQAKITGAQQPGGVMVNQQHQGMNMIASAGAPVQTVPGGPGMQPMVRPTVPLMSQQQGPPPTQMQMAQQTMQQKLQQQMAQTPSLMTAQPMQSQMPSQPPMSAQQGQNVPQIQAKQLLVQQQTPPQQHPTKQHTPPQQAVNQPQPVQQPAQTVQQPSQPVQQPSQPVQQPSQPVQQPSQPVQQPPQPVQQPPQAEQQPPQPAPQAQDPPQVVPAQSVPAPAEETTASKPPMISTPPIATEPSIQVQKQQPVKATPQHVEVERIEVEKTPESDPQSLLTESRESTPPQETSVQEEASPAPQEQEPVSKESSPVADAPQAPVAEIEPVAKPDVDASVAKTPGVAPLPQRDPEGKDRRKKGAKARSKEQMNAKGDKMEGSDMDAFTDTKEKECLDAVENSDDIPVVEGATAAPLKEATPEPAPSLPPKDATPTLEELPPQESKPTPVTTTPPMETVLESKPNEEELKRVAERNEKNSKEHSKTVESVTEPTSNSTVSQDSNETAVDSNEKTIEKSEPVIKKDKIELKYKYREDQWSPLNPEGKMHYDRSFLLQLQYASESMEKPDGLPQLPDVVLEVPVIGRNEKQFGSSQSSNSKGMLDFTPAYVMPNFGGKPPVHQRRSGRGSRASGSGSGGGREGGHKIISIQLGADVKLHQTENAWKADRASKKDGVEGGDDLEDVLKKVRSILNKLTPQKFQKLLQQVLDLGIDTEAKLAGTIDVTFEKAISEPSFSVAYANLCKCMNSLKVPQENNPNEFVMFRKLLLNRCQKEFQRDKADLLDLEKMQKAIDEAANPEEKVLMTKEKEMAETKARRRSLGNIRFIGELFKLRMLTENIMHDCLLKLLRSKDEDSLEALCRLLTTIGKDIDHERAKEKVDAYFSQLQQIIDAKKYSSRLRFMILDTMDLRKTNWVPRHGDTNPKTIEQIHKEAQEEEQKKKILLSTVTIDTKRKGGRGSQSGPHHGQQGEDGWTPVKTTRAQNISIDPAKMKITKQDMDEPIKLGPGGRPGSFGTWGRGSSGGSNSSKSSSKDSDRPSNPGNRYSLLSGGGGGGGGGQDNYDSGRSGYGRSAMSSGGRDSGSRDSRGGRLSQGRDRGKGGISRLSQEKDRESALAAARNIGAPRSTSGNRTPVGSRNQSRESSRNREVSSRDRSSDKRPPVNAAKELSVEDIEKKSKSLIDEYLSISDLKEALLCIKELESPKHLHICISTILTHVLERSAKARQMASQLMHESIKQKLITIDQYTKGLQDVLEFADDMAIDIPQIWKYLGELVGPMVEDGVWPMSTLKTACQPLLQYKRAGLLMAHILGDASHRLGHIKVGELWRHNNMQWSDFLTPGENLQEFISRHKLQYTLGEEAPKSPEATTLPMDRIQRELEKLLIKAMNEDIFDWINANVADNRTRESAFIRALMTAVCNSSITGQGSSCKVDVDSLKKRCILLQRFLDHDAKLELQALYALQALVHKLEHPIEVLRVFFDTLYDEDIISEDAFYQWESSKDSAEQAGKGVAVTSVVQFFTWLREAEEEEPAAN